MSGDSEKKERLPETLPKKIIIEAVTVNYSKPKLHIPKDEKGRGGEPSSEINDLAKI